MANAFVGVIIQVQVCDFDIARRQRLGVHAEAVVLRGNFDLIGEKILYGVIRTVMSEFQLERLAAERKSTNLVAKTDSEDRNLPDKLADIFNGVFHWLRIARTVR